MLVSSLSFLFFFFNDTATTEIYTLSLHDALPISCTRGDRTEARQAVSAARPPRPCRDGACRDRHGPVGCLGPLSQHVTRALAWWHREIDPRLWGGRVRRD